MLHHTVLSLQCTTFKYSRGKMKSIEVKLIFGITCIDLALLIAFNGYLTNKFNGYLTNKNKTQSPSDSQEITLVTAYWNIGKFYRPWPGSNFHDTNIYLHWAKVFQYIMNPLVVYTDSREFSDLIRTIRNTTSHRTQVHLVNRNFTWAFRNIDRTKQVYSRRRYPKPPHKTVIPEYTCAVNSKFQLTALVATSNVFNTTLFAWLDVGYFRDRNSTKEFKLVEPKGFNSSMVAMNEINKRCNYSPERIIKKYLTWVGAGLYLGRRDLMIKFEAQFQRAVEYFFSKHLMSPEEPILHAMYSKEGYKRIKPDVHIQTYVSKGHWFFLGNQMVKEFNSTFAPG